MKDIEKERGGKRERERGRDTLFFFSFLTEFSGEDVAVVVVELPGVVAPLMPAAEASW